MDASPLLEVRGLVKTFPGVRALDGVDFTLRRGEVHALCGENGAGKSTLIHILAGAYTPDSGTVALDGRPVRLANPHAAAELGIGVVFQERSLCPNLSIAENIFAHRQPLRACGLIDWTALYQQTEELLRLFQLRLDPRTPVKALSAALQQLVEVIKAVAPQPRILILDEPTSSLTAGETEVLFANLARLKADGLSFIYVSHHLPEVFALSDRVTVLRDGRHVHTGATAEIDEPQLISRMVGRTLSDLFGRRQGDLGAECFRLEGDVELHVRRGEIVTLAGLAGAGRTELARGIFGAPPLRGGRMFLDGQPARITSPGEAIRRRVAYLTEDRKEQGLFLDMAVRANCVAASLPRFSRHGLMDERAVDAFGEQCVRGYRIATPSLSQRVLHLSGGNQQKVLLALWMATEPRLLIVDEPTRGVDIGARSEIYHRLRELAGRGVGILMISSDLPEVLGMSDRVLVMRGGRLVREFAAAEATEENIIAAAVGKDRP
jgi:ABC-type sugar transport system ATPase subunit